MFSCRGRLISHAHRLSRVCRYVHAACALELRQRAFDLCSWNQDTSYLRRIYSGGWRRRAYLAPSEMPKTECVDLPPNAAVHAA